MGFQPGNKLSPGRPKGSPNKATTKIREAYHDLLENNLDNINLWLAQVAKKDPGRAVDLMLRLSEYILPKLARTEVTGSDGEDLFANVKFTFGLADPTDEEQPENPDLPTENI